MPARPTSPRRPLIIAIVPQDPNWPFFLDDKVASQVMNAVATRRPGHLFLAAAVHSAGAVMGEVLQLSKASGSWAVTLGIRAAYKR